MLSLETLGDGTTALTVSTRVGLDGRKQIQRLVLSREFTGGYAIERELGAGAMGAVFAGMQLATGRAVAIKFLLAIGDVTAAERFAREARLLARVQHPGVLRVLDVGEIEGHPYLVTDLLTGGTLRQRLARDVRLAPIAAVALAIQLLEGLGACHEAGIVHRDLKPENVMFDERGHGVIVDLGIARLLNDAAKLTQTGAVIGTPRYMAPESWAGLDASPATDLFAIGAILHECIAGRHPFDAATTPATLVKLMRDGPPPLTDQARVSTALEDVVLQALAYDPARRPTSAAQMAEALRVAGAGRSAPRARPRPSGGSSSAGVSRAASGRRWSSAGVFAVAAALAITSGVVARRSLTPRAAESVGPIERGVASMSVRPPAASSPAFVTPSFAGVELDRSRPLPRGAVLRIGDPRLRAGVTPAGDLPPAALDASARQVVVADPDGCIRLWDLAKRELVWHVESRAPVKDLAFVRGGTAIAASHHARRDATVPALTLWDAATGKRVGGRGLGPVRGPPSLAREHAALIQVESGRARVFVASLERDAPAVELPCGSRVRQLKLSADGSRLLQIYDRGCELYDVGSRVKLASFDLPDDRREVAFAPDGSTFAIARERTIEIVNALKPNKRPEAMDVAQADHLVYTPDGARIFARCRGGAAGAGTVVIGVEAMGVRRLAAFEAAVAVSDSREHGVLTTERGTIETFQLRPGAAPPIDPMHEEVLAVSASAERLCVAGRAGVRLVNLTTGAVTGVEPRPELQPLTAAIGPSGNMVCLLGAWRAPDGELSRAIVRTDGTVAHRWSAPGGRDSMLQVGSSGLLELSRRSMAIRDLASGRETWRIDLSPSATRWIAIDADFEWVLRSSPAIWDVVRRRVAESQAIMLRAVDPAVPETSVPREDLCAIPAAIAADARLGLLVDQREPGLLLIQGQTGKLLRRIELPTRAPFTSAAFSLEGVRLAVAFSDGTIALYETPSGILRRTFHAPGEPAALLALGARASRMVSIAADRTALVWDLDAAP